LANLPNEYKYLALEQCQQAVTDWLVANNVPSDKVFDMDNDEDCQILKGIFYQEDKPFLDSIKQLLVIVNEAEGVDLSKLKRINSLLDGWKLLSRFGTIPALPQVKVKVEVKPINYTETLPNDVEEAIGYIERLPNDIKLELVKIPAGSFMMGSNESNNEKPIHKVTLKEFYLGKYSVTQEPISSGNGE
jgi:formylglycine-generating enzyme required for sulfatase activity